MHPPKRRGSDKRKIERPQKPGQPIRIHCRKWIGKPYHGSLGMPMRRRVGRPRSQPLVEFDWKTVEGEVEVEFLPEELEALRLLDFEELTQEEAAKEMGVSRGTIWRLQRSARHRLVQGLLRGNKIHIIVLGFEKGKQGE